MEFILDALMYMIAFVWFLAAAAIAVCPIVCAIVFDIPWLAIFLILSLPFAAASFVHLLMWMGGNF